MSTQPKPVASRRLISGSSLLACALLAAGAAHAQQQASDPAPLPEALRGTQQWLEAAVQAAEVPNPVTPLRMEVVVGALDPRLRLAPCNKVEPSRPVGTRLWGHARVGLRCTEGTVRWNVFLPVTIKAFGPAWVMRNNISPGATLTDADAGSAEVDWAEDASPVVLDPHQWVGSTTTRALSAGQTLRQSALRAAVAFPAGTQVHAVAQGKGFSISTDAQSLVAGTVGQTVRLRLDNGHVVSGRVLDDKTVQLDM